MSASPLLEKLIKSLQIMPGIGSRSAVRIAYHLLDRRREESVQLADTLKEAVEKIGLCSQCRDYSEEEICPICASFKRKQSGQLCVVETPSDLLAVESSGNYFGQYFVLHGHLSPIDGVGPTELGIDILMQRLASGEVKELILATNPTVEGDATASYIAALAKRHNISVSKLASGVPLGGDLDNIDEQTIAASLTHRRPY